MPVPLVMVVHPSVPAKTVPDSSPMPRLIRARSTWRRRHGHTAQCAGELFKIDDRRQHYSRPVSRRGACLTDLLGGQVQVYFRPLPALIEHIRAGKLRALAVTTAMRSEALPDVPTVGDFVPGYEASIGPASARPKHPAEIVDKLNKEINAALADPKIKARIADLGGSRLRARPLTSASSSPTKPRSGAR